MSAPDRIEGLTYARDILQSFRIKDDGMALAIAAIEVAIEIETARNARLTAAGGVLERTTTR